LFPHGANPGDPGSDDGANPIAIGIVNFKISLADSFQSGCQGKLGAAIHPPGFTVTELDSPVKSFHLSRNSAIKLTGIIMRDRTGARMTGTDLFPGGGNVVSNWADTPEARDHHAFGHNILLKIGFGIYNTTSSIWRREGGLEGDID
jgi:hypothetical protein